MIRPTNALIIAFIPFLFSSNEEFLKRIIGLFKQWKHVVLALLLFLIPITIQVWFFYLQMVQIRLNSYSDEGFTNWNNPYFWEILFGFRKGIFIYGPILFLLIPGLIWLFFKNKRMFAGLFIFILLSTYVLSSWWCWWYGGSLGFRPIIDFYGIWVIPIAFLAHHTKILGRVFIAIGLVLSVWVYQTYEFQKKKNILHYDYMNYGMWKTVFMKTEPRFNYVFFSDIDTLSPNSVQIGSPIIFSVADTLLVTDKVYGYKGENLFPEWAFAAKRVNVLDTETFIGLRVILEGYLNSYGENPYIKTEYFKDGLLVVKKNMSVGSRFEEIKAWEYIRIDIKPDLKWSEVDSIKCSLVAENRSLQFKNINLQVFKFK